MLASVFLSINPFLSTSSAFGLGLLCGIFIYFLVENVFLFPPKKEKEECPVCKQTRELQEKEEEALKKEWKDQKTGYKN